MAIRQVDLPGVYGAAQQYKTGQLQNQLQQMQLDSGKQAMQTQNQLRPLLAPAAQGDPEALNQVMSLDPDTGMKFQEHANKMTAAQREQMQYEAPILSRLMADVKDQDSYAAALNVAASRLGVDIEDFPEQYDPNVVSQIQAAGREVDAFTLSQGQTRFGPDGQPIASVDPAPAKPGSPLGKLIAERDALPPNSPLRAHYDRAIAAEGQGDGGPFGGTGMDAQTMNMLLSGDPSSPEYLAAYNHYAQPKLNYNPQTGQSVMVTPDMSAFRPPAGRGDSAQTQKTGGPGLTVEQVGEPRLTEGEKKAAGFANRMKSADAIVTKFEDVGASAFGSVAQYAPNILKSDERQKLEQAQRDFVNAILRQESGAVISDEEFDNAAQQYFPQPGDGAAVVEQKRQARKIAVQNMRASAGRAPASEPPPQQPQTSGDIPPPPPGFELVQ